MRFDKLGVFVVVFDYFLLFKYRISYYKQHLFAFNEAFNDLTLCSIHWQQFEVQFFGQAHINKWKNNLTIKFSSVKSDVEQVSNGVDI